MEPRPTTWIAFARAVITRNVHQRDDLDVPAPPLPATAHGGVFVTLHKLGRLRGCMGTLDPDQPLPEAVRYAARHAAMHDPRFPAVTPDELADIDLDVSILSAAWPMRSLDELELGRHGILVRKGQQRGLFLPQVATDHHLDKVAFLSRCCAEKAGLPADAWRDPETEVLLFTTAIHRER